MGSEMCIRDRSLVGLEENKAPIYNKSERSLIENTTRVRLLVEQLEKKETDQTENKEATKDEAQ